MINYTSRPLSYNRLQEVTFAYEVDDVVTDKATGIKIPTTFSYVNEIVPQKDGNSITFTVSPNELTPEVKERQIVYRNLKHECGRAAEHVNEKLRTILIQTLPNEERETLIKLDFTKLRSRLSELIKVEDARFHAIEQLDTAAKRKSFTRSLQYFIDDRNIYIHGHLHIRVNDNAVVISYIDGENARSAYCIINDEIIQSFLNVADEFSKVIDEMHKILLAANNPPKQDA